MGWGVTDCGGEPAVVGIPTTVDALVVIPTTVDAVVGAPPQSIFTTTALTVEGMEFFPQRQLWW